MNKQELVETLKQVTDYLQEESAVTEKAVLDAIENERFSLEGFIKEVLAKYPEEMNEILFKMDFVEAGSAYFDELARNWAEDNDYVCIQDESLEDVANKYDDSAVCEFVKDFVCDRI